MITPHHGRPYSHGERVDSGIIRQILDAIRRLKIRVEWPLMHDPTTNTIWLDEWNEPSKPVAPTYIQINGAPIAGGRYPWTLLVPNPTTGALEPKTGTDLVLGTDYGTTDNAPAWEINENMSVVSPYNVEAWLDPISGTMRFRATDCAF